MDGETRLVWGNALTFSLQIGTNSVSFPSPAFKTLPPTIDELLVVLALSSIVFIAVEIENMYAEGAKNPLTKSRDKRHNCDNLHHLRHGLVHI
jgi:hypothetical protein